MGFLSALANGNTLCLRVCYPNFLCHCGERRVEAIQSRNTALRCAYSTISGTITG